MGVLFAVIVIGCLISLFLKGQQQVALKRTAEAFYAKHAGWDIYIAPFGQGVVAINHEARTIVLGTTERYKQYAWSAIASVDVIRDGASITSTNRGSQLMGAAIGGVVLGPLGLLMGGITGSKRSVQRVRQIAIKIIVDDRHTPTHAIEFLRLPGDGADPANKLVKDTAQRAEHVHALLVNAIRNSSLQASAPTAQLPQSSLAEQINRLWQLRECGALTASEFGDQKARLLASAPDHIIAERDHG